MEFLAKDMEICTGGPLICIIHHHDAKKLDLRHGDRVKISKGKKEVTAILDLSESRRAVQPGFIGLFEEVLSHLQAKDKDLVELNLAPKPESVFYIKEKLDSKFLDYSKFYSIIKDIVDDNLTEVEKTFFISATYCHKLREDEVFFLTKAMIETGIKIKFAPPVFDLHSIGGIPGNRTTMVVVPIVAALGLKIPKTSSRAITSPAGTADTMEVFCRVGLDAKKIKEVVKKTKACIVWGGGINLAPADDKIIKIEHPLSIDAESQILASITAKKVSVSASHLVLEIPYSHECKIKDLTKAKALSQRFINLGKRFNLNINPVIIETVQPVGDGLGPVLEANDVLKVLKNEDGPSDLKERSLLLASKILEMTKVKNPFQKAKETLESGLAYQKFLEIIKAQGETERKPKLGKFVYQYKAKQGGKLTDLICPKIAKICRIAGAPEDKGAGIYLNKKEGERFKKGETLFTLYANSKEKFNFALNLIEKEKLLNVA